MLRKYRVESRSDGREVFRRTEVKVEGEQRMEIKALVGTGVLHSLLGAESQSWTSG